MRPGRAADQSHPSSAVVMEQYSYTSTHPLGHTGPLAGKLYLYLFKTHLKLQILMALTIHILILRVVTSGCPVERSSVWANLVPASLGQEYRSRV